LYYLFLYSQYTYFFLGGSKFFTLSSLNVTVLEMTTAGPGFLGRLVLHDLAETIIPGKLLR
jgi:hypothetical protein